LEEVYHNYPTLAILISKQTNIFTVLVYSRSKNGDPKATV